MMIIVWGKWGGVIYLLVYGGCVCGFIVCYVRYEGGFWMEIV